MELKIYNLQSKDFISFSIQIKINKEIIKNYHLNEYIINNTIDNTKKMSVLEIIKCHLLDNSEKISDEQNIDKIDFIHAVMNLKL